MMSVKDLGPEPETDGLPALGQILLRRQIASPRLTTAVRGAGWILYTKRQNRAARAGRV
jgi:hypothetical protein